MEYRIGLLHYGADGARDASDDLEIAQWEAAERSDHARGEVWAVWEADNTEHPLCICYQGEVYPHVTRH